MSNRFRSKNNRLLLCKTQTVGETEMTCKSSDTPGAIIESDLRSVSNTILQ